MDWKTFSSLFLSPLTCGTDFVGVDVTDGSSLVGALRVRLERRKAIGKLSSLRNSSSMATGWTSWLVSSFFPFSGGGSSWSAICLRFLPLAVGFGRDSCSASIFFAGVDVVRRFFFARLPDFLRPRDFFTLWSSWLLLISCLSSCDETTGLVSFDDATRERWPFLSAEVVDSWSDGNSVLTMVKEKGFFEVPWRLFSILIGSATRQRARKWRILVSKNFT